jgi:hypothetical protein
MLEGVMRKRTREEMAEYQRVRRAKLRVTPVTPRAVTPQVTPVNVTPSNTLSVTPVTPCKVCQEREKRIKELEEIVQCDGCAFCRDMEIKNGILRGKIVSLEKELKLRPPLPVKLPSVYKF